MTDEFRPTLVLTTGDPTGIGPEMTARILAQSDIRDSADIVVLGDRRVLEMGMTQAGVSLTIDLICSAEDARHDQSAIPMIDLGNMDPAKFVLGAPDPEIGARVGDTLKAAVDIAARGPCPWHLFCALAQEGNVRRRLALQGRASAFCAFAEFQRRVPRNERAGRAMDEPRHLSCQPARGARSDYPPQRISEALHLTDTMLRRAGIAAPRIAVAALNPHKWRRAGCFGTEEIDIIRPAGRGRAGRGYLLRWPISVRYGLYGGVCRGIWIQGGWLCIMNQGQIAIKLREVFFFQQGRNGDIRPAHYSLQTPAHGTAHDIVGQKYRRYRAHS